MPDNEVDIETETNDLKTYWKDRDAQMLADRDIINLVKPEKNSDEIKWLSNEPKVFYETATSLISSYPPRFRLPLTINYTPEQKDKMNKAERFVLGIFRNLDARQGGLGGSYWLRELAWWINSGWYSVFTWVRKGKNGVEFLADLWDSITVYPEWDADELVKCVRTFEIDKRSARQMVATFRKKGLEFEWSEPTSYEITRVINYWMKDGKDVYNALSIAGQVVKDLTVEKNFKRIPIFVGAIGVPEKTSPLWAAHKGESIIAANRDMYEYTNQMVSLMATIMAETAWPQLVSKTKTGQTITKRQLKGYGEEIPLKIGETLDILKHAATPAEVQVLLNTIAQWRQHGSIPDIVYGGVPVELSGFAISQLMAAIRYKIAPYLNTMKFVISQIATEFLTQYRDGNFPKISLSTVDPKQLKKGQFFVEEFSPKDVPDSLYVDVSIPITSAMDKTQQMLFARQAMSPPQLLSRETLWDDPDILDVQDSEQEYTRILQDQMLEMPVVKQIGILEELRKKEQSYRYMGQFAEAGAIHKYIMMIEMQLGMREGIPTAPGAGGVPPQASPPEMGATGQSPDVMRSAMGVPPPGLSRRPQTPTERLGSKSGLVSASGQPLM